MVTVLVAAFAVAMQTWPVKQERTMLRADEFPIMAWGSAPGDRQALDEMRASGINLAGMVRAADLDQVHAAGLMALVDEAHVGDAEAALSQEEIDRRVQALVDRVAGHPAVLGYYLRDEPNAALFPGLGRWADAYRRLAPGELAYVSLFPNYATPAQLGSEGYEQHLEEFVRHVRPQWITYNHYALMDDGSLRDGYFQNLEAVRRVAQRHNLPFSNIVLANAHFHYADPTDGGLRFQVYTTLAYGGRGISYFTYFAPNIGNYRLAPIDQFMNRTPTWYMLRNVNMQIHTLGPTLLQLRSVGVVHHPNVPSGSQGISAARHVAEVSGGDLLVGEFDGPAGEPYALVVNKNRHRSTPFSVRFRQAGTVMMVNAYTGARQPWVGENVWLAPGQGMLLFVSP